MESGGAMKKIAFLTVCLIFAVTFVVNAQGSDFPKLSGSYLETAGDDAGGVRPGIRLHEIRGAEFDFLPGRKRILFLPQGNPGQTIGPDGHEDGKRRMDRTPPSPLFRDI
jgi:hypothetical protein